MASIVSAPIIMRVKMILFHHLPASNPCSFSSLRGTGTNASQVWEELEPMLHKSERNWNQCFTSLRGTGTNEECPPIVITYYSTEQISRTTSICTTFFFIWNTNDFNCLLSFLGTVMLLIDVSKVFNIIWYSFWKCQGLTKFSKLHRMSWNV